MHLLNANTFQLEEFNDDDRPQYAILSHRWQPEEVTYRDIKKDTANSKRGFLKLRMACKRTLWDGLGYIWIDTCCIDKRSSAELSEAVNSMYRWYAEADRCYAYLYDVSSPDPGEETMFRHSVWFERCWTLQELIAPQQIYFYDRNWREFGTRESLHDEMEEITKVPFRDLRERGLESFPIAQRMSWAAGRKATRKEDVAYSLMGIFNVNMPLLYGEGVKAFGRLQEEIIKRSTDRSIMLWNAPSSSSDDWYTILAKRPSDFITEATWRHLRSNPFDEAFQITSAGMHIKAKLFWNGVNDYYAVLRDLITIRDNIVLHLRLVGFARKRMMFVKLGAAIRVKPWLTSYHEVPINILRYPKVQALSTLNAVIVEDCRLENPFKEGYRIEDFLVDGQSFNPDQTSLPQPSSPREWSRTVQIVLKSSNSDGESSYVLNFRLGFDFWSRLICLYGQSSSTNWNGLKKYPTIPATFKGDNEEMPPVGVRHIGTYYSKLVLPHNESTTTSIVTPLRFRIQLAFTPHEAENRWMFRLLPPNTAIKGVVSGQEDLRF